jgi:hypothetical protein
MTTCVKDNLVEDVLAIININHECLINLPESEVNGKEALQDMHTHLCELLSKMITGPLTGRVYMPGPEMYVSSQDRLHSLRAAFET